MAQPDKQSTATEGTEFTEEGSGRASDMVSSKPNGSRFQLIKDPKSVFFALGVMGLTMPVVVWLFLVLTKTGERGEFLVSAMTGVLFFLLTGMAFWLAWGKSHFFWRLVAVDFGLVLICLTLRTGGVNISPDVFAIMAFLTATIAIVVALPKLWGVRRCAVDADGRLMSNSVPANQFSTRDLFRWTACGAIIVSTIRWGGIDRWLLNPRMYNPNEFVAELVYLAVATLISMWLTLRLGRPRILWIAISTSAFCAATALADQVLKERDWYFFWATTVVFALSLPFHYIFRLRGFRLVRNPNRLLAAQAETPSTNVQPDGPTHAALDVPLAASPQRE